MATLDPLDDDERGVIISCFFEGQVGQAAYAASKGGVVALTILAAREFAQFGIRVLAIAPGLFETPMLPELPRDAQESRAASIPFPGLGVGGNTLTWFCMHPKYVSQWRGDPSRRRSNACSDRTGRADLRQTALRLASP
jgi:NAD(P)-dependent dehydrogenase (short-subunit alcohol dehydrogenase family)